MGANQRLTSLESALEGKERIFARFKKAQALGGFFDYCEAALEVFAIEDEEAAFFFHLASRCNVEVLELLASPVKQLLAICLLCLARSKGIEANEAELSGIRVLLHNFVVEGFALESAIQQTCLEHFDGIDILFDDLKQKLAERNQHAKRLLQGYNAIGPKFGLVSIAEDELQSSVTHQASAKANDLTVLTRAEAAADYGCVRKARELLHPMIADGGLRQFIMQTALRNEPKK